MAEARRSSKGINNEIVNIDCYYERQNKLVYHVMTIYFIDGSMMTTKVLRAFIDDEDEIPV